MQQHDFNETPWPSDLRPFLRNSYKWEQSDLEITGTGIMTVFKNLVKNLDESQTNQEALAIVEQLNDFSSSVLNHNNFCNKLSTYNYTESSSLPTSVDSKLNAVEDHNKKEVDQLLEIKFTTLQNEIQQMEERVAALKFAEEQLNLEYPEEFRSILKLNAEMKHHIDVLGYELGAKTEMMNELYKRQLSLINSKFGACTSAATVVGTKAKKKKGPPPSIPLSPDVKMLNLVIPNFESSSISCSGHTTVGGFCFRLKVENKDGRVSVVIQCKTDSPRNGDWYCKATTTKVLVHPGEDRNLSMKLKKAEFNQAKKFDAEFVNKLKKIKDGGFLDNGALTVTATIAKISL